MAFAQWMCKLGHTADLLAFTKSGKPSKNFVTCGLPLHTHRISDYFDVINSYELAFMATPGDLNDKDAFQTSFAYLTIPFITMIHGEYDHGFYKPQEMAKIVSHVQCKALLVVSPSAASIFQYGDSKPRLTFYPCTMPGYLLKEGHQWSNDTSGLIYAARVATVKHPQRLAELTLHDDFLEQVQNKVVVRGISGVGIPGKAMNDNLAKINPRWERRFGFYNVYDTLQTEAAFSSYRFYWEVFGSRKHQFRFRRFNLSAVEAMRFGCIPVGNPDYIPRGAERFTIPLNPFKYNVADVVSNLREWNEDYDDYRESMREWILNSFMSYEGVKAQVIEVLDVALS
jgi:hypothetical protein